MISYSMFPCMGAIFLRSCFAHVDNVITKGCSKQSHGCSCQGCKATNPTGTLQNLPPGTYTSTRRNSPEPSGTRLRNLYQHTPELSGTFWNLPPEPTPARAGTLRNLPEPASGTYTSTHRNSPEPCGTASRIFQEPTPAHTGTLHNLPPEPTPAHAGTLRHLLEPPVRNLPEPSSGTCSCDPRRHTPELIWAEDPISLRCWGKLK